MPQKKIRIVGSYHGGQEVYYREERARHMRVRLHQVGDQRVLVPTYWPPDKTPALLALAKIYGVHEYDWPRSVRLEFFGRERDWPLDVAYEMPF